MATAAQQKVIDQLRAEAAATIQYIDEKSSGITRIVSGDDGSAERYAAGVATKRIDGLERTADTSDPASWADGAREVHQTLSDLRGYRGSDTFEALVVDTAKATGETVKAGINTAAEAVGGFVLSAIPWWVYVAGLGLVLWKVGALQRRRA